MEATGTLAIREIFTLFAKIETKFGTDLHHGIVEAENISRNRSYTTVGSLHVEEKVENFQTLEAEAPYAEAERSCPLPASLQTTAISTPDYPTPSTF